MSSTGEYVTELNENDVLFGRGSGPNDHEGNVRFRLLVSERKAEYMATSHRQTKARIAREIVDSVLAKHGRFLKKAEPEDCKMFGIPAGVDAWLIVDDETVMEKAKQALRQNREKEKPTAKVESKVVKADTPLSSNLKECPNPTSEAAPLPQIQDVNFAAIATRNQDELYAAYGMASMPSASMPLRGHIESPNTSTPFISQIQPEIPMQQGIVIPSRASHWGNYETSYGISQQAIQLSQQQSLQQAMQPLQQAILQSSQQPMEPLQRAALQKALQQQQQAMPPPLPVQNDLGKNSFDDGGRLRFTSDHKFSDHRFDDSRRESLQVQDLTVSFHHMKTAERNNMISGDSNPRNYDSSDTMGTIDPIPMGSSSVGMSVASMSSSTLSVLKGAFGESMASTSFGEDEGGTTNRRGSITRPAFPTPPEVPSIHRPIHDVSLRFSQVWYDKNKTGIIAITEEAEEHDNSSGRISDPRPLSLMEDAPDNLSSLGQSSLSIMKAAFEGGMGSSNETYGSPMQDGNNSSDVSSQMISSNDGTSSGLSSMGASATN